MSQSLNHDADEVERRIQSLLKRVERPAPHTRHLLGHLTQIEEALDQGASRGELAEIFGLTPNQFAAAIAGARRLAKQGGDGRRTSAQARKRGIGSSPASHGSTPPGDNSLVRKF